MSTLDLYAVWLGRLKLRLSCSRPQNGSGEVPDRKTVQALVKCSMHQTKIRCAEARRVEACFDSLIIPMYLHASSVIAKKKRPEGRREFILLVE